MPIRNTSFAAAVDKIDENRDSAACRLHWAAATLHEQADQLPGGEKMSSLVHATADKLNTTAGYVREHDVDSMMTDAGNLVKKNPVPCLVAAGVAGFVVGRALRVSNGKVNV